VLSGPNVHLYSATHATDPVIKASGPGRAMSVNIQGNAWIGGSSVITTVKSKEGRPPGADH